MTTAGNKRGSLRLSAAAQTALPASCGGGELDLTAEEVIPASNGEIKPAEPERINEKSTASAQRLITFLAGIYGSATLTGDGPILDGITSLVVQAHAIDAGDDAQAKLWAKDQNSIWADEGAVNLEPNGVELMLDVSEWEGMEGFGIQVINTTTPIRTPSTFSTRSSSNRRLRRSTSACCGGWTRQNNEQPKGELCL